MLLDSAGGAPARFTLLAFDPLPAFEGVGLAALRAAREALAPSPGDAVPGPFHGGFLGALSYDLGVAGEELELPRDEGPSPLSIGRNYADFCVVDHERGAWYLVLGEEPGDGRAPLADRRAELSELLTRESQAPELVHGPARPEVRREVSSAEHRRRIEVLREAIAEGELYQANLAHRLTCALDVAPDALFRELRRVNPAPYMAYLDWSAEEAARSGGARLAGALLSASPELLCEVAVSRTGSRDVARAWTRPIKGTAPRSEDPLEDAQHARSLLASEKDRAELAMIVDLERNDLGRVARIGTVTVGEHPRLESYRSVHHLVADVSCELAPGRDALDVLSALFPGGSITGAPKVASMRHIAALEGRGRGFFTGSLGFVDTRGHASFNILIRTLVWRPGEVSFHVGGGITWSSDPLAEDRETLAKGEALARSFGATLGASLGAAAGLAEERGR